MIIKIENHHFVCIKGVIFVMDVKKEVITGSFLKIIMVGTIIWLKNIYIKLKLINRSFRLFIINSYVLIRKFYRFTIRGGYSMKDFHIEKIEWLQGEIERSPRKLKYLKYDTFLELMGMKHRTNFKLLNEIDDELKKRQITIWRGSKEISHLKNFARGGPITFRILHLKPEKDSKKIKYPHAGTIKVASGKSNLELFKHQEEAIKELDKILSNDKKTFKGLLVLPTGAGKTLTATYWLLKNYTDKNKKILWIAHRHELLEQAKNSFAQLGYEDILKNRDSFSYRIISGIHDKPVNIKPTDDIIISSKDSLNSGFEYLNENWIKHNSQDIFLVIDEAHHATAKTYRRLINNVKKNVKEFKMLGLTATPFRTAKYEQGLLKKVFPDDIVYKTDLRTLIDRNILSDPIFYEKRTKFDMVKILDEKELDKIQYFDIDSIGKTTAKTIAENRERNHCIVDHYIENKFTYKQTLVFALNIDNAIALNSLFKENGAESEYVVSTIRDSVTGVSISSKDNKNKIDRFRRGDLDVLVNVNILTEGTDLPEIQTIFLARPTISTILMTQMIGRGLRGVEAGGTNEAYIVGFIDDWKDKVAWVNPEKLFIEENTDFNDKKRETEKKIIRLVSLEKIEEFASIMEKSIDTDELETLEFIERIPIGIYSFTILKPFDGEEREKNCEILVYNNIDQAYVDFINSLSDFFHENNLSDKESLNEGELEVLSRKIEDEFFYGCEKHPGYLVEDIKDLLSFYAQKEVKPDFIELKDRNKFDLSKLAKEIYEKDWGSKAKKKFLDENWDKDESKWRVFFGFDKKYFINEIDLILRKLEYPELYKRNPIVPEDEPEKRKLEKLSMSELRECCPEYWKNLSDSVFEKFKDTEGYYFSAMSGFKSKSKLRFQIDHKIPLSKGGLTKLSNLQLLTREENALKGDKLDFQDNKFDAAYKSLPQTIVDLKQELIRLQRRKKTPETIKRLNLVKDLLDQREGIPKTLTEAQKLKLEEEYERLLNKKGRTDAERARLRELVNMDIWD